MVKKHSQEFIENYFIENGCILIDIYKDARSPMEYICECGNISYISFDNFKRGKRCKRCGLNKLANKFKHSHEYVKNYFYEKGCELLSTEYINVHSLLDYKCECGNHSKIRFSDFQKGQRCWECKTRKLIERDKLPYEFVKQKFEEENCVLLEEEYTNAHQKLRYVCSCGNESSISYDKFSQGQRCDKCKIDKVSGENHYKYDHDITDEERMIKRNYPEYREWSREVKIRDNYTCQHCGQVGGKLTSHHINNYKEYEDSRIDIENGITFCEDCHIEFHKEYGYTGTTIKELNLYLDKKPILIK